MTQGDIISPILFNIIIDCVVRKLERHIDRNQFIIVQSTSVFYADDGAIFGCDPVEVQGIVDTASEMFKHIGLYPNASKTKQMTFQPPYCKTGLSIRAYSRMTGKIAEQQTLIIGR